MCNVKAELEQYQNKQREQNKVKLKMHFSSLKIKFTFVEDFNVLFMLRISLFKGFQLICNLPFFGSCFIHLGINFLNLAPSPPPPHVSSSCFLYKPPNFARAQQTKQDKPILCCHVEKEPQKNFRN